MLSNALKKELTQLETPVVGALIRFPPTGCGVAWYGCGNCAK